MSYLSETKIFIDGSYFMFNCFTELINDEKFKYVDLPENIFLNKKFVRVFEKKFVSNMYRISKNFNIHFSQFIFVRDCSRVNIWRNQIYEEYKKNRPIKYIDENKKNNNTNKEKTNNNTTDIVKYNKSYNISNLFKYIYHDFMVNKCQIKLKTLKFNKLEADDIIAICAREYEKININSIIITGDSDFIQLCSNCIKVYDLAFNNFNDLYKNRKIIDKIICGDKSDNIIGINEKYNKQNIIENLLNIDVGVLWKNIQLIDFNNIPINLMMKVVDSFTGDFI